MLEDLCLLILYLKKMTTKKIKFIAVDKEMTDVWPHPKPAIRYIPDEYKKLKRFLDGDFHKATVKTCMPFLDSMSAGYIIPFTQDFLIDSIENDFTITPANRDKEDIGYHSKTQLPESWKKITGENAGKFINKWLIRTPPGYSCLFIHPMNRTENRWKMIEGIVDTDTYINTIHFPFILNKRDESFLIKKGEPLIQVIPFKRESWKMWSGFYLEKEHSRTLQKLMSEWVDKYKKMFWHKKDFR